MEQGAVSVFLAGFRAAMSHPATVSALLRPATELPGTSITGTSITGNPSPNHNSIAQRPANHDHDSAADHGSRACSSSSSTAPSLPCPSVMHLLLRVTLVQQPVCVDFLLSTPVVLLLRLHQAPFRRRRFPRDP